MRGIMCINLIVEYDDDLPLVDPYLREYIKELEEQLLGDLES